MSRASAGPVAHKKNRHSEKCRLRHHFFLCLFLRRRFLRLCVAIFLRLRLRPLGIYTRLSALVVDAVYPYVQTSRRYGGRPACRCIRELASRQYNREWPDNQMPVVASTSCVVAFILDFSSFEALK